MYSNIQLKAYTAELFARRNEGVIVQPAEIQIGDWQPQENECHRNVGTVCANRAEFTPVRGWLFFPLTYPAPLVNFVLFNAHSVISNEDGTLFDITPSRASQSYPFIRAKENDGDFLKFVLAIENYEGVKKLQFYWQSGNVRIIT